MVIYVNAVQFQIRPKIGNFCKSNYENNKEMNIKSYIYDLASTGKYFFIEEEALKKTTLSKVALHSALRRLKKKGQIASPFAGFFIIIPPEYHSLGSLPPDQFIDGLTQFLKLPYYVGLLSAAQYYGAAHQQPQIFQVIVPRATRNIQVGRIKIVFITKSNAEYASFRKFNTPRGFVRVATPEVVATDLIMFPHHSGGFSRIFNVLSELSEQLKIEDMAKAIQSLKRIPFLQRLGYFFELLGMEEYAQLCENELKKFPFIRKTKLDPQTDFEGAKIEKRWNLIININLEEELDT